MNKVKRLYTTGEIAKMLDVSPRTVNLWFDKGLLTGYRIPLSGDRRIARKSFINFLEMYEIPKECLNYDIHYNVLTVGVNVDLHVVNKSDEIMIYRVDDAFGAGVFAGRHRMVSVFVDTLIGLASALTVAKHIRNITDNTNCCVVAIVDDGDENADSLLRVGFNFVYKRSEVSEEMFIKHIVID